MKKVVSNNLTAGMLSENFKQRVREFLAKDKAFSFINWLHTEKCFFFYKYYYAIMKGVTLQKSTTCCKTFSIYDRNNCQSYYTWLASSIMQVE